jgi:transposase
MEKRSYMAYLHSVWKTHRPCNPSRTYLLPPFLRDSLREGHLAYILSGFVDQLDHPVIEQVDEREERGRLPYYMRKMVKVLPYAECVGVRLPRTIAKRIEEDVAFLVLWDLAEFRSRCLKRLAGHFVQVLTVCKKSGLASLKHAALDGTKIRANASTHKAITYGRMKETRAKLGKEILELSRSNECLDEEVGREFGLDELRDELPEDLVIRERRLANIGEPTEALEEGACADEGTVRSADTGQPAETSSILSREKRGPKPISPPGDAERQGTPHLHGRRFTRNKELGRRIRTGIRRAGHCRQRIADHSRGMSHKQGFGNNPAAEPCQVGRTQSEP